MYLNALISNTVVHRHPGAWASLTQEQRAGRNRPHFELRHAKVCSSPGAFVVLQRDIEHTYTRWQCPWEGRCTKLGREDAKGGEQCTQTTDKFQEL